jgi:hypothetical protein
LSFVKDASRHRRSIDAMPWSESDYPAAMNGLPPAVRHEAIAIAKPVDPHRHRQRAQVGLAPSRHCLAPRLGTARRLIVNRRRR